jgi:hypothetical protein
MGIGKTCDSRAAFRFEVPGSNLQLALQELQIGGTSVAVQKSASSFQRVRHADF